MVFMCLSFSKKKKRVTSYFFLYSAQRVHIAWITALSMSGARGWKGVSNELTYGKRLKRARISAPQIHKEGYNNFLGIFYTSLIF